MTTRISPISNNFTSGELTPRLDGRTDLKQYFAGASTLENVFVYPHGGVTKRPGTKYIAACGDSTEEVNVIPFQYSTEQTYILEFGHGYIRFYRDGGQIWTHPVTGAVYEIDSPYAGEDVLDLRVVQSADTMYIAHNDYAPRKLTRLGHTSWTLEEVEFYGGPFLDENSDEDISVHVSSTTGTVEVTASSAIFDDDHVGAFFRISGTLSKSATIEAEDNYTSGLEVDSGESFLFNVSGTWDATVTLQRSFNSGATWLDYANVTANTSTEIAETKDNTFWRCGVATGNFTSGTIYAEVAKYDQYGYMRIDAVLSDVIASGAVIKDFPHHDPTTTWSEGAWSTYRGFPKAIGMYEQRLIFAGSTYRPQTIWGSQVDDYENFSNINNADDEAYKYVIASSDVNTIHWLLDASRVLLFGTHAAEWKFGLPDVATTPTSVDAKKQSAYGSSTIQALPVAHLVLFLQKGATKLRSMSYDFKYDSWLSPDISLMAEHLLESGIVSMCYLGKPDNMLIMVTSEGDIVSLTFNPEAQIAAFAKWTTVGTFEAVATIPGEDRDELWCVVKRDVDGTDFRFIEQFQTTEWTDVSDAYYLDSGIEGSFATPTYAVSGATHLEGQTVTFWVDGATQPNQVIADGAATLPVSGYHWILGHPYTAKVETMSLDVPTRTGTAQGKPMANFETTIKLFETIGCSIGYDEDVVDIVPFRDSSMSMNEGIPLFTGDKQMSFNTGYRSNLRIWVISEHAAPLTVVAIIPTLAVSEF